MTPDSSQAKRVNIKSLPSHKGQAVELSGWVQNRRDSKGLVFLVLRDGSGFVQCVISKDEIGEEAFEEASKLTQESAVELAGIVKEDDRQIGGVELSVTALSIISGAVDYPISNKAHGVDFLMDRRHLWLRSKRQWAIMRIRNRVIFSIHEFFQNEGFVQMDAPIFTGNACEGTTNLFETDFFDSPAYLSQSGQLYGEAMAMAMGKIYTFGPTFRAEKSKTRRHLSEFWMIEPEMAFYNLEMTMDLAEQFLQYVLNRVIEDCAHELEVIGRDTSILEYAANNSFERVPYAQAVRILRSEESVNGQLAKDLLAKDLEGVQSRISEIRPELEETEATIRKGGIKKGKLAYLEGKLRSLMAELKNLEEQERNLPQWMDSAASFKDGSDFGGSDETVLTRMFSAPVMVYNWPKAIKAFYMKEVDGEPTLVKGVDILAPEGYGEIVGGGERETNISVLEEAIEHHELPKEEFEWYLDLRRYGSVPHAGFGLGLERLVSWICKISHVRETIPFPRLMGRLLP